MYPIWIILLFKPSLPTSCKPAESLLDCFTTFFSQSIGVSGTSVHLPVVSPTPATIFYWLSNTAVCLPLMVPLTLGKMYSYLHRIIPAIIPGITSPSSSSFVIWLYHSAYLLMGPSTHCKPPPIFKLIIVLPHWQASSTAVRTSSVRENSCG